MDTRAPPWARRQTQPAPAGATIAAAPLPEAPPAPDRPATALQRRPDGTLLPGQAPLNTAGRPKVPRDVRRYLRSKLPRAVQVLGQQLESPDERIRQKAAITILERNLGKVVQPLVAFRTGPPTGDAELAAQLAGMTEAQLEALEALHAEQPRFAAPGAAGEAIIDAEFESDPAD